MAEPQELKTTLQYHLQSCRDALVWKLDGLSEYESRRPRTRTGNNLLGVVKHCLNVEAAYFGLVFGRAFPTPHELVSLETLAFDTQATWYAREDETQEGLVDLYRRVWVFSDETIMELPIDAPGRVPWWTGEWQDVTLYRVLLHVVSDLSRHAGHADILREVHDGAIGWEPGGASLEGYDWPAYVAKLTALADLFRE